MDMQVPSAVRYAWGDTADGTSRASSVNLHSSSRGDARGPARLGWDASGAHLLNRKVATGASGSVSEGTPNGNDVSCCEGDGTSAACLPAQCPLHVEEQLALFGALPIDPFLAEIVGGKCLCPEPQMCSA